MTSRVLSLKKLTFDVIIDNFSRFVFVWRSSKDENLQKNLLFLQRAFTQLLFWELRLNYDFKKDHLDFLLNKHLRKLDVAALFKHLTEQEILEKIIPIAYNLEEVYYNCYVWNEPAKFILSKIFPHSINVKKAEVRIICNDELLEIIASSCPGLIELNIRGSNVTGKGISTLCLNSDGLIQPKCALKRLNLLGVPLERDDIAFLLNNLPSLEEILHEEIPSAIESVYSSNARSSIFHETIKYNLVSLDFSACPSFSELSSEILTACTETCLKLKILKAEIFTTEDLNLIGRFLDLENLNLTGDSGTDINDFLVLRGSKLKQLFLNGFQLSGSILVDSCPNLEGLSLYNIEYQNMNRNSVKSLSLLHFLYFKSQHSSEDAASVIQIIFSSPNVEKIAFTDFDFDDISSKELLKFSIGCNLRVLSFYHSNVQFDFLKQFITNCRSIRYLTLSYCSNVDSYQRYNLKNVADEMNRNIYIYFAPRIRQI